MGTGLWVFFGGWVGEIGFWTMEKEEAGDGAVPFREWVAVALIYLHQLMCLRHCQLCPPQPARAL